jgi:hypothetical protein
MGPLTPRRRWTSERNGHGAVLPMAPPLAAIS